MVRRAKGDRPNVSGAFGRGFEHAERDEGAVSSSPSKPRPKAPETFGLSPLAHSPSPLRKRLPRELRNNLGKYLGMFLLLALAIAFTTGFLVAASSIEVIGNAMRDDYNTEDGHFATTFEADDKSIDAVEALGCRCAACLRRCCRRHAGPHVSEPRAVQPGGLCARTCARNRC